MKDLYFGLQNLAAKNFELLQYHVQNGNVQDVILRVRILAIIVKYIDKTKDYSKEIAFYRFIAYCWKHDWLKAKKFLDEYQSLSGDRTSEEVVFGHQIISYFLQQQNCSVGNNDSDKLCNSCSEVPIFVPKSFVAMRFNKLANSKRFTSTEIKFAKKLWEDIGEYLYRNNDLQHQLPEKQMEPFSLGMVKTKLLNNEEGALASQAICTIQGGQTAIVNQTTTLSDDSANTHQNSKTQESSIQSDDIDMQPKSANIKQQTTINLKNFSSTINNNNANNLKSLLDIGCGIGSITALIKNTISIDYSIGIDLASKMTEIAQEMVINNQMLYNKVHNLCFSSFYEANRTLDNLKKFDIIILDNIFSYSRDISRTFAQINTLIANNGVVVILFQVISSKEKNNDMHTKQQNNQINTLNDKKSKKGSIKGLNVTEDCEMLIESGKKCEYKFNFQLWEFYYDIQYLKTLIEQNIQNCELLVERSVCVKKKTIFLPEYIERYCLIYHKK